MPESVGGRRRLLVAAVGVATASFLGKQGCSCPPRHETFTSGNLIPPPHEAGTSEEVGEADATRAQAHDAGRDDSPDTGH